MSLQMHDVSSGTMAGKALNSCSHLNSPSLTRHPRACYNLVKHLMIIWFRQQLKFW